MDCTTVKTFRHDVYGCFGAYAVAIEVEWQDLYQKGLNEMYQEDFCAMWMLLTVWGQKPL